MSERLTLLLDSTIAGEVCAGRIADDPALLEEAREALPALRAVAIRKAGTEGVKAVIGRRFALYPQPARSEAEAAAWWVEYFDVLADVGLAQLEAAMRAYVALPDSEFMPKPGKLLELSKVTPCRSIQRYHRARRAAELAIEAQPVPERADPAEVKRLLEEFRAGSIKPRSDNMPYTGGVADERGVTPEMRAVLARQANG